MKTDQMRQYDIVDALRGIGYVLLTDDSIDEFAAWDTLREYPLDEHTLGE